MSLKSRLRRLDADVHWLETKGVARRKYRMKLARMRREFAGHRMGGGMMAGRKKSVPPSPPNPVVANEARPPPRPPEPAPQTMPGQPVALPSPDMEIRPTRWRARTAQDYDEEERPGTNGRCLTEYDPLRDEDDDDA